MLKLFRPVVLALVVVGAARAEVGATDLHAILKARLERSGVTGITAAMTLPDGTLVATSAGLARRGTDQQLQPTSRMMGGSSGKTFVAAVMLGLIDEGKASLDDKVSKHLGENEWFARLPNAEAITIRKLLNHTSGIRDHVREPAFAEAVNADPMREWEWDELLGFILDSEPLFEAGEAFGYADTNFVIVGMIIEHITGRTVYELVEEQIQMPLAMHGTIAQTQAKLPGLVSGYNSIPLFELPEEVCVDGVYAINPQWEWCGGGFVTNSPDMARWIRAYADGSLYSEETHAAFLDGVAANTGPGDRYGLGLQIISLPAGEGIGHSGFMPGFVTIALYFPELDVSVALQVNESTRAGLSLLRPLASELARIASEG